MAEWIDELGNYLSDKHADKFQLTKDRHWKVKTRGEWTILPDHYKVGLILAIIGGIGLARTDGALGKALSAIIAGLGFYLILDDLQDLSTDINNFFQKKDNNS